MGSPHLLMAQARNVDFGVREPLGPNASSPGISHVTLVTLKLGSQSSFSDGIRSPEALRVNGMPWVAELGMMSSQQRQDPALRGAAKPGLLCVLVSVLTQKLGCRQTIKPE